MQNLAGKEMKAEERSIPLFYIKMKLLLLLLLLLLFISHQIVGI
jgi:hypothetical protein